MHYFLSRKVLRIIMMARIVSKIIMMPSGISKNTSLAVQDAVAHRLQNKKCRPGDSTMANGVCKGVKVNRYSKQLQLNMLFNSCGSSMRNIDDREKQQSTFFVASQQPLWKLTATQTLVPKYQPSGPGAPCSSPTMPPRQTYTLKEKTDAMSP